MAGPRAAAATDHVPPQIRPGDRLTIAELEAECPSLAEHVKAHLETDPVMAAQGVRLMAYDLLELADQLGGSTNCPEDLAAG